MPSRRTAAVALTLVLALAALGAGCDGKPSYCSKVDELEVAVKDLGEIDLSKGVSSVTSAVTKVQSSANAAVDAAKKDFPTETGQVQSSVTTLKTAVDQVPSSPSTAQIATLALDVRSVVNAVDGFASQTKKKCD
jgi:hypothetical protein